MLTLARLPSRGSSAEVHGCSSVCIYTAGVCFYVSILRFFRGLHLWKYSFFWIGVLTLCLLSPRLYPDEKLGKSWKREEHARLSRVYLPSRLQRLKLGVNLSSPWSAKAAVVNKACRCLFSSSSLIFFNLISTVFCFKHNGIRFNRILPRVAGKNFL